VDDDLDEAGICAPCQEVEFRFCGVWSEKEKEAARPRVDAVSSRVSDLQSRLLLAVV
jgi:hypothetical protein